MKSLVGIVLFVMSVFVLAACGGQTVRVNAPVVEAPQVEAPEAQAPAVEAPVVVDAPQVEAQTENAQSTVSIIRETLVDEQGAVAVSVTPLATSDGATTLDFEVAMNTHSVDLSMNLAELATLVTDTGQEVTATAWSGEAGGHHVSGILSFPATNDGAPLLDDASAITLTLENVDAPTRTFSWDLQ